MLPHVGRDTLKRIGRMMSIVLNLTGSRLVVHASMVLLICCVRGRYHSKAMIMIHENAMVTPTKNFHFFTIAYF